MEKRCQYPGSRLNYTVDWSEWLAGRTIATSTFVPAAGLTLTSPTHDNTTATVLAESNKAGKYRVTNSIETTDGLRESYSFLVCVQQQGS